MKVNLTQLCLISSLSLFISGCATSQLNTQLNAVKKDAQKTIAKASSQNLDVSKVLNFDKKEKESLFNAYYEKNDYSKWLINKNVNLFIIVENKEKYINAITQLKNKLSSKVKILVSNKVKNISNNMYLKREDSNKIVNELKKELNIPTNSMVMTISTSNNHIYGFKSVQNVNQKQNTYFFKSEIIDNIPNTLLLTAKLSIPNYYVIRRDNKLLGSPSKLKYILNTGTENYLRYYENPKLAKINALKEKISNIKFRKTELLGQNYIINTVSFLAKDKAVGAGIGNDIFIWDLNTGKYEKLKGHTSQVSSIEAYDNGTKLVTGSYDNTVGFWDLKTKKVIRYTVHEDDVNDVDISYDEKYLLSAGDDDKVIVWDLKKQEPLKETLNVSDEINNVKFIEGTYNFVSGDEDDFLKKFVFMGNKNEKGGVLKNIMVDSIDTNKDIIAIGSYDKIYLLNKHLNIIKTLDVDTGTIYAIDISDDGKYLLTGDYNENLTYWDIKKGSIIKTFKGHTGTIKSVKFSKDGNYAISGGSDKTIYWKIKASKKELPIISKYEKQLKNLSKNSSKNDLYQYVFTESLSKKDLKVLKKHLSIFVDNNKLDIKDINKIAKQLNLDFADPILTSSFTDSYQYSIGSSTKILKNIFNITVNKNYDINNIYFSSKYDLEKEGYKLIKYNY